MALYGKVINIDGKMVVKIDTVIQSKNTDMYGWLAFHLTDLQVLLFCAYLALNTI